MERNFRKKNARESFDSQEVSCLLGSLSFGVHLAVLSFSCATEGPTSVIPHWQKEKCESESALGDTRRGYSVNCTPARLTLLREECRRGFACLMRYAAAINVTYRYMMMN